MWRRRREIGRILPTGAGADTIGAVNRDMPEWGVAPGGLGRRTKEAAMTTKLVALVLLCLMTGTAMAQQAKGASLRCTYRPKTPGRAALIISLAYPPGSSYSISVHNGHALVYILEG